VTTVAYHGGGRAEVIDIAGTGVERRSESSTIIPGQRAIGRASAHGEHVDIQSFFVAEKLSISNMPVEKLITNTYMDHANRVLNGMLEPFVANRRVHWRAAGELAFAKST
jgi:hypothetical protein